MQILPGTAEYLARRSGAITFTISDLATPAVNIAYGSYYLRYLLYHYGGREVLALAAYNGGITNVGWWDVRARRVGRPLGGGRILAGQGSGEPSIAVDASRCCGIPTTAVPRGRHRCRSTPALRTRRPRAATPTRSSPRTGT